MNKQKLEELMYEFFNEDRRTYSPDIENFILGTVIPEVLKSVVPSPQENRSDADVASINMIYGFNLCEAIIKKSVKELYGIDL